MKCSATWISVFCLNFTTFVLFFTFHEIFVGVEARTYVFRNFYIFRLTCRIPRTTTNYAREQCTHDEPSRRGKRVINGRVTNKSKGREREKVSENKNIRVEWKYVRGLDTKGVEKKKKTREMYHWSFRRVSRIRGKGRGCPTSHTLREIVEWTREKNFPRARSFCPRQNSLATSSSFSVSRFSTFFSLQALEAATTNYSQSQVARILFFLSRTLVPHVAKSFLQ